MKLKLQKKLQKKRDLKEKEDADMKDEFSYLLSLMCFGYSMDLAIENRRVEIDLGLNIDKGQPEIYSLLNAVRILNEYNNEYKKYIQCLQKNFDENYEDCLIKSNFLFAIADSCDKNEPIEEIQKKINKNGKDSFDKLAHSSSEFIMNIFNGNKVKFKWFFDVVTKMEYYKNLKIISSCFVCGTTRHLNYCSCRDITYCSVRCQSRDWETHKLTCKFYFKKNCKKEFDYIISQPFNILVLEEHIYSKLDQKTKNIIKELNHLIHIHDNYFVKKINLLDDSYAFDLMIKRRAFLYMTKFNHNCIIAVDSVDDIAVDSVGDSVDDIAADIADDIADDAAADVDDDGVLCIYKNTERAIKELKKMHILGNSDIHIENLL